MVGLWTKLSLCILKSERTLDILLKPVKDFFFWTFLAAPGIGQIYIIYYILISVHVNCGGHSKCTFALFPPLFS